MKCYEHSKGTYVVLQASDFVKTGKRLHFTADLPPEFEAELGKLRG